MDNKPATLLILTLLCSIYAVSPTIVQYQMDGGSSYLWVVMIATLILASSSSSHTYTTLHNLTTGKNHSSGSRIDFDKCTYITIGIINGGSIYSSKTALHRNVGIIGFMEWRTYVE